MAARARTWALLAASYFTLLQTVHILWTGRLALSVESLIKALVLPAIQVLLLAAFARVIGRKAARSQSRGLTGFFLNWALLAFTLAVATPVVEYGVTRRVVWTDAAFLLLLAAPTAQAAALALPFQRPRTGLEEWRPLATSFRTQMLVAFDVALLLAGWGLAEHPLLGMAMAAPLQRWWIAFKLAATALGWGWLSLGAGVNRASHRQRLSIAARSTTSALFRAAVMLLFLSALAAAMNLFLSLRPVSPWAPLAMTTASLAATMLLLGVVAATVDPRVEYQKGVRYTATALPRNPSSDED